MCRNFLSSVHMAILTCFMNKSNCFLFPSLRTIICHQLQHSVIIPLDLVSLLFIQNSGRKCSNAVSSVHDVCPILYQNTISNRKSCQIYCHIRDLPVADPGFPVGWGWGGGGGWGGADL